MKSKDLIEILFIIISVLFMFIYINLKQILYIMINLTISYLLILIAHDAENIFTAIIYGKIGKINTNHNVTLNYSIEQIFFILLPYFLVFT